jgi:hypothetical protein
VGLTCDFWAVFEEKNFQWTNAGREASFFFTSESLL